VRTLIAFLLAFYIGHALAADYPPLAHLGIEQGLSNNSVRCIFQDHDGYIWFGTYDGLNRYDGYEFKVFRNKLNDSASLPHNYIYAINEDHHHNIWIGTGQGIGIYNKFTSKFSPAWYTRDGEGGKKYKIGFNVTSILTDPKGNVLIGTDGWGFLMQPEGSEAAIQIPCRIAKTPLHEYDVQATSIDASGRIWLFIRKAGLCLFDPATRRIRLVNSRFKEINCMVADDEAGLWLGTSRGLYRYSIAAD
jgi:ligand-binding sensor domain-containing protein